MAPRSWRLTCKPGAAAISAGLWLVEREAALPYEALAILAIVLLNAVMGYLQEPARPPSPARGTPACRGVATFTVVEHRPPSHNVKAM